ncbi:uncharacterized protein [Elaeis guineensis]|uniref:uncharacterized protein n=1 Tax=Elaeis guineensis var. tenera TaxID=51953 RepID=UPI003C6CE940
MQHILYKDFAMQPPWDLKVGKIYIIHHTYGCNNSLKDELCETAVHNLDLIKKGAAPDDLYAIVMGQEQSRHIRMVGLGLSPENYWGKNKNHVEAIRKAIETTEEVRALKQELQVYRREPLEFSFLFPCLCT